MRIVKWGILSTARIGINKVIPAMKESEICEIIAIASRELDKAKTAADTLKIRKAYGSYEELLQDPEVEAVYNPLPNHLHVPYSIKAIEAGKHVLCEKPVGLSFNEAELLLRSAEKFPELKVMEAFMYRFHPQWLKVKELVRNGRIGTLRTVNSFFSYNNTDPNNIRNIAEIGGGGLMDIGCYCVSFARYLFEAEPEKVIGSIEFDPIMKTDKLTSGLMQFEKGTSTFTCSTQLSPYQRTNVFGTKGRIEIQIPVNAPSDRQTRIFFDSEGKIEEIVFDICDQYRLQGDAFSRSIIEHSPVPTPLEDALGNMKVIDAIVRSTRTGGWEKIV